MRVVQVVPSLATGGAEHVAVDLSVVLRDLGHESHLISLGAGETDPALLSRLHAGDVSVHLLDKRMGPDPTVIKDIRGAISQIGPQVVHTHLHALRYVLAGGAPRYLPVVHTVHNDPHREHSMAVLRYVDRMGYRRRAAGVVLSPSFVEPFLQIYGRPPAAVIPNGVSDIPSPISRPAMKANGDTVAVFVGRLEVQKRTDVLLEAFARAAEMFGSGLRLVLIGDGQLKGSLEDQAAALGIADSVSFRGRLDPEGVVEELASADMLVLSSDWEGLPLSAIEAMKCGLPIVATRVGAMEDLVEDGESGFLVEPSDSESLARCIAELADDPQLAESMGRAGRVASEKFTLPVMGASYESLYRSVTARERHES